jgi:hypothetical protein
MITPGTGRETIEIFLRLSIYSGKIGSHSLKIYSVIIVAGFFDWRRGQQKC